MRGCDFVSKTSIFVTLSCDFNGQVWYSRLEYDFRCAQGNRQNRGTCELCKCNYVSMEFSKTVPFYLTDMKLFPLLKLSEKIVFSPQYHTWVGFCIFLASPHSAAPPQEIYLWCLQSHAAQTSGLPVCLEDVSDPLLTPKEKTTTRQIRKKGSYVIFYKYWKSHGIAGGYRSRNDFKWACNSSRREVQLHCYERWPTLGQPRLFHAFR